MNLHWKLEDMEKEAEEILKHMLEDSDTGNYTKTYLASDIHTLANNQTEIYSLLIEIMEKLEEFQPE